MIKFLIIGNNNAITYKEFFPYIKNNQVWLGRTLFTGKMPYFKVSQDYALENDRYERRNDGLYKQVNGICWFTNITNNGNREILDLFKKYNPEEYPKYDNYDAIECGRMIYLPMDYDGVIGVPITSLKYLYSDGKIHANIDGVDTKFEILGHEHDTDGKGSSVSQFEVNGKGVYARILIKKNAEFEIVDAREIALNDKQRNKSTYLIKDSDGSINVKPTYARICIKKVS